MDEDYEYISRVLRYEESTGLIRWNEDRRKVKPGHVAGTVNNHGYIQIYIDRKFYFGHRLAWLLFYGEWPDGQIDHIDHDRTNNRIKNLRVVDHYGNHKNKSMYTTNTSRVTGVDWHKKSGKWRVRVHVNQKEVYLGTYRSFEEAVVARKRYLKEFGYHENHGV